MFTFLWFYDEMAKKKENSSPAPLSIDNIDERAEEAQNKLIAMTTDAIGIYLVEYLLEMEVKSHANDKKITERDIHRWLKRCRILDKREKIPFTPSLQAALYQINKNQNTTDEKLKNAIRGLVGELFCSEPPPLKTFSERLSELTYNQFPDTSEDYTKDLDEYSDKLEKIDQTGIDLKGNKLDDQEKVTLDNFILDFNQFRDGLVNFPKLPDSLIGKIPFYQGSKALPEHPASKYIQQRNAYIIDRRSILRNRQREKLGADALPIHEDPLNPSLYKPCDCIAHLVQSGRKSHTRILEKLKEEVGGDIDKIRDAARVKIVVDDFDAMTRISEILTKLANGQRHEQDMRPVKMGIRGAWDCKSNLMITLNDGSRLASEVQMIDHRIQKVDHFSHRIYSLVRTYSPDGMTIKDNLSDEEVQSFVKSYNRIVRQLKSRGDFFEELRESNHTRFDTLKKKMDTVSSDILNLMTHDKPEVKQAVRTEVLGELVHKLTYLHQTITTFAAISRANDDPSINGVCHPSMSAVYYTLANRVNKKLGPPSSDAVEADWRIPEDFLPKEGIDFSSETLAKVQPFLDVRGKSQGAQR